MLYEDCDDLMKLAAVDAIARKFGVRKQAAKKWLEDFPTREIGLAMKIDPFSPEFNDYLREIIWGDTPIEEIRRICADG